MRRIGSASVAVAGTGFFLAITGGWVFVAAIVALVARILGRHPDPTVLFEATAAVVFIAMNVAVLVAILHYRSSDS